MLQADYNNDGHPDVLVLRGAWSFEQGRHPNSLLRNNGDGTFTDVTLQAGLADSNYPTQTAAWGDYDLDGDLDLYVGNEPLGRQPSPSQLFRNNADGTFTEVAAAAGVDAVAGEFAQHVDDLGLEPGFDFAGQAPTFRLTFSGESRFRMRRRQKRRRNQQGGECGGKGFHGRPS